MSPRQIIIGTFLVLGFQSVASGQFSGYTSISSGYSTNPLYNYETIPDQVRQQYIELRYKRPHQASFFQVSYVGGLMLFNRLQERNYYEHGLNGLFEVTFRTTDQGHRSMIPDEITSDEQDTDTEAESTGTGDAEEEEISPETTADSTDAYLGLPLKLIARHDKEAFKEFDNYGVEFEPSFRFPIMEGFYARLSSAGGWRRYTNITELSNLSEYLTLTAGTSSSHGIGFSVSSGAGLKYYTETVIDTARFESKRSYMEKPSGKGKPGAKIIVPSDKQILTNPESKTIVQMSAGFTLHAAFKDSRIELSGGFRHNFTSSARYLAQFVNSSFLNDDIYNDFYSYGGWEIGLSYKQNWPFGIESILRSDVQIKKFGAPALNLVGEQIGGNRRDVRFAFEYYIQKFINLSSHTGMGFFVAGTILRNSSNDMYNDYSIRSISAGVAVGMY